MFARPSQERILQLVLAASAVFSLGGVAYAIWFGQAADGARGGAIAVAISFAALFAARSTPEDVIELQDASGRRVVEAGTAEERIGILQTALATMIDSQRLEKIYLTWSSTIGTLTWGFGDVVARWLGASAG